MENSMNQGSIYLILGCMYSGKTTEIIRLCEKWGVIYDNILCINFSGDTRYGENEYVYSHSLAKVKCIAVTKLSELDIELVKSADMILINEGQFFCDIVEMCKLWADVFNKKIIVSGLDGDYKREPFGDLLKLIPLADGVEKLNALCSKCRNGTHAPFTGRITKEKEQILIGASDHYVALCRKHHCELMSNLQEKH